MHFVPRHMNRRRDDRSRVGHGQDLGPGVGGRNVSSRRGVDIVCRVCGAVSPTHDEPSSTGALRYCCATCGAEWSADAPPVNSARQTARPAAIARASDTDRRTRRDRRVARVDRRMALIDRRESRRSVDERASADPATTVTRAEHERLLALTQQNVRAIRGIEDQLRQIVEHLRLGAASESSVKARAS